MHSASKPEFDIEKFKSVMEEAPSPENGWNFEYEGIIDKNFKDSTMKVYNQTENPRCGFTTRIDATLKGVKAKNLLLMSRDISLRKQAQHPPKRIKSLEKTAHTDIIYVELDLPYPLINRDMLEKRLFVGNKENPELVKKLELFDWNHRYYVMIVEPTQRLEYPAKSMPIRAEMKMHHMLLEEDPNEKDVLRMKLIVGTDLRGDIPNQYMSAIRQNAPFRMMTGILACYQKFFGKTPR